MKQILDSNDDDDDVRVTHSFCFPFFVCFLVSPSNTPILRSKLSHPLTIRKFLFSSKKWSRHLILLPKQRTKKFIVEERGRREKVVERRF